MSIQNVLESTPPEWMGELRRAMLHPHRIWVKEYDIDIIEATAELYIWLTDSRPYETSYRHPWISAIDDFDASRNNVGPHVKRLIRTCLNGAVSAVRTLKKALQSTKYPDLTNLSTAQEMLKKLKACWTDPNLREAAWNDLLDACKYPTIEPDAFSYRRDFLWKLVSAADFERDEISRLTAGVLYGSAFDIYLTRRRLGDIADTDSNASQPGEINDIAHDEQIELCQRLLTLQPVPAHHIVWLAFRRARLGSSTLKMGPISFWNCEWLRAVINGRGSSLSLIPSELTDTESFFRTQDLPDCGGVVLVRVDLGIGSYTDPVRFAIDQAEAVIAAANFYAQANCWQRILGHLSFIDGNLHTQGYFEKSINEESLAWTTDADAVEAQLDTLAPRVAQHLPVNAPDLAETLRTVRWWQQASNQTPTAALILHVRILELVSTKINAGSWDRYIESHLRSTWVRNVIKDSLYNAIYRAIFDDSNTIDQAARERLAGFRSSMVRWGRSGYFSINLPEALMILPDLVTMFPRHSSIGRNLQYVTKHLESVQALTAWRDELGKKWHLLQQRLMRVRNSVTHGGPNRDSSADALINYAQRLAAWTIALSLESILEGQEMIATHNNHMRRDDDWYYAIPSAPNVSDALNLTWS
jgi:hypothetical protein